MDKTTFDRMTRTRGTGATRRGVLGGLAASLGAAVAGAPAVAGALEAERRKKKRKKAKVCRRGQQVASVQVPASGATALSPVLRRGQRYRLRAVGAWTTNAQFGNDAFAAFPFANPNAPETVFQGVRLGLAVDGGSPDQWGSYNPNHIYERQVVGRGTRLSFRFTDPAPADNSGTLTVDILCA